MSLRPTISQQLSAARVSTARSDAARSRRRASGSLIASFLAGVLGGTVVVGVVTGALALTGGLWTTANRVLPQRAAALPATAAKLGGSIIASRLYEADAGSVVLVTSDAVGATQAAGEYLRGEGGGQDTATGSGFEIDGHGDILTNWHVIQGAARVTVSVGERAKALPARLVGADPRHDLALLRVTAPSPTFRPLALGRSHQIRAGEPVFAIGNPFGYGRTLTNGIVSAPGRDIQGPSGATIDGAIQTDAPIDPGSSGGPLLNEQGEVIGINSLIVTRGSSGGNAGIGFAIPIDTARAELGALESGRPVDASR